ncbi:MAG TPA: tetratricopeptide repeat protein [Nitrospiraceae bacterium]|nr:tetratricopeptide repeat protein [Nitrospiraceae bacterium]
MNGEYSATDLCRILRLSASGLRSCLQASLLPVCRSKRARHYSFQHLLMVRTAKGLREAGVSLRQIRTVLDSLRQHPGEGGVLSSLRLYASGRRVVVWDGQSRWQPDSGQFLLNFDSKPLGTLTTLPRRRRMPPSKRQTSRAWFERAMRLQDESPVEARRAYQEALRLQPTLIEAHLNLGLLFHHDRRLTDAEACYRRALHYAPTLALAHFNLAVVLEDQHNTRGAIAAYKAALSAEPTFRDAHWHLAQLYERLGRRRDAFRHYAAAKRLSL